MSTGGLEQGAEPLVGGRLLAEVTNRIVALMREHYGRGPIKAKTYVLDNLIVCVLSDGFTAIERTMVEGGEPDRVLDMRRDFQRMMKQRYSAMIEQLTERKVLAFLSQAHIEPDLTIEMFLMDGPVPGFGALELVDPAGSDARTGITGSRLRRRHWSAALRTDRYSRSVPGGCKGRYRLTLRPFSRQAGGAPVRPGCFDQRRLTPKAVRWRPVGVVLWNINPCTGVVILPGSDCRVGQRELAAYARPRLMRSVRGHPHVRRAVPGRFRADVSRA